MGLFNRSILRQLVVGISASVALLLIITSYFIVSNISQKTEIQLIESIEDIVQLQASEVRGFFEAKGQINHSVFANPLVIDWFDQYKNRLSKIDTNTQYQQVKEYFHFFSESDKAIKSVFFGSANTFEYFDLNGRYDDAEYFTNKRPWWEHAIAQDKMFVTDPAVDQNDGSISATITSPYYLPNGKLLGIGGIDILISTIGKDLLSSIKYQGEGEAFLMTNTGKLVFFPGFNKEFPPGTNMQEIDKNFQHAEGFSRLQQELTNTSSGISHITWNNEKHVVVYNNVTSNYPQMNWKLGFMVPQHLITNPVTDAIWSSSFIVIAIIVLIGFVVWLMILPVIKRIQRLQLAMHDIATGEGDLTKRIEPIKNDEIGLLVSEFNFFVDKIQHLVKETVTITKEVDNSSITAAGISIETNKIIDKQKKEIDQVATSANDLAETSEVISINANRSSELVHQAESKVSHGESVVSQATEGIINLSNNVIAAADVVNELKEGTQSIGEVLNVIRGIAEQTNLLALNAAIEAARAGEQGRGFAVVADEVRTLASRTQESTANIERIIERLQTSATNAVEAMENSRNDASASVEIIEQVQTVLSEMTHVMNDIQSQTQEIATSVEQQTNVAREVSLNIENVRNLSDDTVEGAASMEKSIEGLQSNSTALTAVVYQFKV